MNSINIVTHNGRFHTDEVCACAFLSQIHKVENITRTRDPDLINYAQENYNTVVVDVGMIDNVDKKCFDHHQKDFNTKFNSMYDFPMSSFGLVYTHYGEMWLQHMIKNYDITDHKFTKENCNWMYNTFYHKVVAPIDANDNGISITKYIDGGVRDFTFIGIISSFNHTDTDSESQNNQFAKAVNYASNTIKIIINTIIRDCIEYSKEKELFNECVENNPKKLDEMGILYLSKPISTDKFIHNVDPDQVKYKIIIVNREKRNEYALWTIKKKNKGFETLVPLVNQKIADLFIDDLVFIHKKLFIGACKSYESAVLIAKLSVLKVH